MPDGTKRKITDKAVRAELLGLGRTVLRRMPQRGNLRIDSGEGVLGSQITPAAMRTTASSSRPPDNSSRPLVPGIFATHPPNALAAIGAYVLWTRRSILYEVPLRGELGKPCRQRVRRSETLTRAERAPAPTKSATADFRFPFVPRVFWTAPPHFLVTVRPHILRHDPLVARRMPLRSELRVRFRERIGDRHTEQEYRSGKATQTADSRLPAPPAGARCFVGNADPGRASASGGLHRPANIPQPCRADAFGDVAAFISRLLRVVVASRRLSLPVRSSMPCPDRNLDSRPASAR